MAQDYAIFGGQRDLPHFGHLVDELYGQNMLVVLRDLMRRGEIESSDYSLIAEKLGRDLDPETFEILITLSHKSMTNGAASSWDGIDALSAYNLHHYLASETYRERAQAHLINLLAHHGDPTVRALAAEALGSGQGPAVISALKTAATDEGQVRISQSDKDFVRQYAQEALQKIQKAP